MSRAATSWPLAVAPRIRNAGRFPLSERGFRYRYMHDTVAMHLHAYRGVVRIGEHTFELVPGDVTVTPANVPSFYDLPRPGTHLCIHAWTETPARGGGGRVALPLHLRPGPQRAACEAAMLSVIDLHARSGRNPAAGAAASAALQALCLMLAAEAREPAAAPNAPVAERAVRQAATLLTADLRQDLDVPRLAREAALSQNYLARLFRQRYGLTMQQYRLRARVEHAELLLATTDLPVKVIAAQVGLPDPQHFNKRFRAVTGRSPSAVRAAAR